HRHVAASSPDLRDRQYRRRICLHLLPRSISRERLRRLPLELQSRLIPGLHHQFEPLWTEPQSPTSNRPHRRRSSLPLRRQALRLCRRNRQSHPQHPIHPRSNRPSRLTNNHDHRPHPERHRSRRYLHLQIPPNPAPQLRRLPPRHADLPWHHLARRGRTPPHRHISLQRTRPPPQVLRRVIRLRAPLRRRHRPRPRRRAIRAMEQTPRQRLLESHMCSLAQPRRPIHALLLRSDRPRQADHARDRRSRPGRRISRHFRLQSRPPARPRKSTLSPRRTAEYASRRTGRSKHGSRRHRREHAAHSRTEGRHDTAPQSDLCLSKGSRHKFHEGERRPFSIPCEGRSPPL
ncbi:hypothetical protein LTR40_009316, partial [Exophiala xenobiotica]